MSFKEVRHFGSFKMPDVAMELSKIQRSSYNRFLQNDKAPDQRDRVGLEALLHEVFPIISYDESARLEYIDYELGKPRYSPDECRQLRLTYGLPFRVRCRLIRKDREDILEDSVYLGEMPIMIGGGEFIINGAERVIVNQLHRSPGVDFVVDTQEGDRPLHACRIIPDRGSWIEINVTKKDVMIVRIDQSGKLSATTFLRAMDPRFSSSEAIIREFYPVKKVAVDKLKPEMWTVAPVIDTETGEEIVKAGCQLGENLERIQQSTLKDLEVCNKIDPVLFNSLAEDPCEDHDQALLRIYTRLRPGNPTNIEKARILFQEKFYDDNRYRLGRVGRFRLNRKFDQQVDEGIMTLRPEDFIECLRYIVKLRNNEGQIDDIDHLGNRRLRTIDELAADEIRKGLLKLRRSVQERMSIKNLDEISRISELINSKSVTSAVDFFFGRGELSQVVDQTNPLSQLTHERRLSALGPGGLNRKRAGFEVRDVHISHYGRICPIETPEGTNIGLISSLSIFSSIDEYGFLITPYREVTEDGKVGDIVYLRADQEIEAILAPVDVITEDSETLCEGMVLARVDGDLAQVDSGEVEFIDLAPNQTVGVSASLIPFLEHDDANRALMGSNMQRQSVPLLQAEPPVIATGIEKAVASNSSMVVKARQDGVVTYVDAMKIIIDEADEYPLRKFVGLNERTCLNQKPIVSLGQQVKKDEIIADGASTCQGELALGRNALVGFMMFDGYNFEDAILISERLVRDDIFTSVHIDEYEVECRETKLGREEFTNDIPNVSEKALANLDENGVVRIGTRVKPGDILVGKVSPKSKSELSPEEKLLYAIFGRAGEDVKNDSLEMPSGEAGIVIDAKRFSRRMYMSDDQKKKLDENMKKYDKDMSRRIADVFRQMARAIETKLDLEVKDPNTAQKMGASSSDEIILEQVDTFTLEWVRDVDMRPKVEKVCSGYLNYIQELKEEKQRKLQQMKRGDELPSGVLEMVKVYVATKRCLGVGDKMAGRHGNKGVIARILPVEDMPYLEDGTPLDILLNPLGVPGRMNVGQILETHLGWAAKILGFQAVNPVFNGASEEQIRAVTDEANAKVRELKQNIESNKLAPNPNKIYVEMPGDYKLRVYDGRTGEPFEQKITVGYMYLLKLHHLVDDKIHARATGPYSLITQQPLGGKARTGGQRFGEMEVWGLEAYGTAYILQELLTVKSDDVEGRTKIYESMVKGTNVLEAGTPVSFDVLCNEIRGLGLNIQLEKKRIS